MALQIISCKRKAGDYEGRHYDNFVLTCADYESTNKSVVFGPDIEELKIKADAFSVSLGRNIGALNDPEIKVVQDIEGLLIVPVYNKFGNVVDFTLSKGLCD